MEELNFSKLERFETDIKHLQVANILYDLKLDENLLQEAEHECKRTDLVGIDYCLQKITDNHGNEAYLSISNKNVVICKYNFTMENLDKRYVKYYKQLIFDFVPTPSMLFLLDLLEISNKTFSSLENFNKELALEKKSTRHFISTEWKNIEQMYSGLEIELDYDSLPHRCYNVNNTGGIQTYLDKILKVDQITPTTRLALITNYRNIYNLKTFRYKDNPPDYDLSLYLVQSDNELYDYLDEGRLLFGKGSYNRSVRLVFFDVPDNDFPRSSEALDEYVYGKSDAIYIINAPRLKNLVQKYANKKALRTTSYNKTSQIYDKLISKFKLSTEEKPFVLNGVSYFQDYIKYQEQILKFDKISILNVLSSTLYNKSANDIDFDVITENFIREILRYHNKFQSTSNSTLTGMLGTVEVELVYKGQKGNLPYLNNYKIKYDDLIEVLKRALCYNTTEEYNEYLSHVSNCSLHIYERLVNGLRLCVTDYLLGLYDVNLVIPITRKNSRNYININNKEFKVSDINALINLERSNSMLNIVQKLAEKTILKEVEIEDIGFLIKMGKEYYQKKIEHDAEMKRRMEQTLDIKENTIKFANGVTKTGYLVAGEWKTYFVDSGNAEAFSYPDGNRICMITKHDTTAATENVTMRVFERAMVLKNDSRIADRVETLKVYNKMEKE